MVVAGLWRLANPSQATIAAYAADPALARGRVGFAPRLAELLRTLLVGLLARDGQAGAAGPGAP